MGPLESLLMCHIPLKLRLLIVNGYHLAIIFYYTPVSIFLFNKCVESLKRKVILQFCYILQENAKHVLFTNLYLTFGGQAEIF